MKKKIISLSMKSISLILLSGWYQCILAQNPGFKYSTFFGGTSADLANAIKIDKDGYLYVCGSTRSADFPATTGAYCTHFNGVLDGYVAKIDLESNKIVWATYIGGSDVDYTEEMALDDEGNIYITGNTLSNNFPVTTGAFDTSYNGTSDGYHGDLYVAKVSNDGSKLIYSTFLGGKGSEVMEHLTVDEDGCAYVCASNSSPDYPVTCGSYNTSFNGYNSGSYLADVVVSKLSKGGDKLEYSFFLGGRGNEIGRILRDSKGNLVIVGTTSSINFPVTNGTQFPNSDSTLGHNGGALYITVIDSAGKNLLYSTFVGGSKANWPNGIMIDRNDNLFITGAAGSSDFPVTQNAYQKNRKADNDAFLLKFNLNQKKIEYCTYIGGALADAGNSILKDKRGNIVLIGTTLSSDFPFTHNALDTSYNGCNTAYPWGGDYFISVFDSTLSKLVYSTYLGGKGDDYNPSGIIDSNNNIYFYGGTRSSDFPVTTNAIYPKYSGGDSHGGDAILIKFSLDDLMNYSPTGINDKDEKSMNKFQLNQNYPYPFNPSTVISYQLPDYSNVKLKICDTLGHEIKNLVDSYQSTGEHSIVWNGTNEKNNSVSSGIYFYCLQTNEMNFQKKTVLIRYEMN